MDIFQIPKLNLPFKKSKVQRFLEVTDQFGMAILSVIPGNPLVWTFQSESEKSGISECVTSENLFNGFPGITDKMAVPN